MAGKEILPFNRELTKLLSRGEEITLCRIGDELGKEFERGNDDINAFLRRVGANSAYVINRLIIVELHNILSEKGTLRESFEITEGQAKNQMEVALKWENREETVRIFHFLDNNPEHLVHLKAIDWLLGIQEVDENLELVRQKYGDEQYEYQGTPYEFIADFLHALNLGSEDVLYDLGSGYGRIVLYAAITTNCGKCKGIEIVPERVRISQNAARSLLLSNVEFIQGNVIDCDFSDGTVFFLFNPFTWQTLEKIGEKFKKIASKKKIRIVTWGGPSVAYLERQSWLRSRLVYVRELTRPMSWGLYIFESLK